MIRISLFVVCLLLVNGQEEDIRLPPSIHDTSGPKHIFYREFGTVDLPCFTDGRPQPEYRWLKNGAELNLNQGKIVPHPDATNGAITIQDLATSDEGYYQCTAKNDYGKSLSPVYFLQRAVLSVDSSTDIAQLYVDEGDPLRVECKTRKSVPQPTYSWEFAKQLDDKNPKDVRTDSRINLDNEGNLYFSYTKPEDAHIEGDTHMIYKCNARNNINDQAMGGSYTQITVNQKADPGNRKPQIERSGSTNSPHIAVYGDKLEIRCLFTGRPEVTITWSPSPSGKVKTEKFETALVIESTNFSDERTYTCTGKNSAGEESYSVDVKVEASPTFPVDKKPKNMNATEGFSVAFDCGASPGTEPEASVQWLINGEPINNDSPGTRTEITDAGTKLTIQDVCKVCSGGGTDLKVIQCNISNIHGYSFADAYLNVLLATKVTLTPESVVLEPGSQDAVFTCEATTDPSTPLTLSWYFNDKILSFYPDDPRLSVSDHQLTMNLTGLDTAGLTKYAGPVRCQATNGYTEASGTATVTVLGDDGNTGEVTAAGFTLWWIFVIIAVVLLILIVVLVAKLCCQRNQGDSYPVDKNEKKHGNDPEQDLIDSGFKDFQRRDPEPVKRSLQSLPGSKYGDDISMEEYGDLDAGKFTEDGSFVGVYQN